MATEITKKIAAVLLLIAILTSVIGTWMVLDRLTGPVTAIGPPGKANLAFSIGTPTTGAVTSSVVTGNLVAFSII